jgi:hypothetical protein
MNESLYETRDYEMFEFFSGNRNINPAKVKDLLRSFNERHYPVPIIVDQQMRVLDGQHRLEAARAGGFPVFFLKLPEDIVPTQVIRQLNADQKPYSLPDHLKLYVDDERGNYVRFQNLYEHYDKMLEKVGISQSGGPHRIIFTSMLGLLCGRDDVEGKSLLRHASKPWDQGSPKLTALFRNGDIKLNTSKGIVTLDYLVKLLGSLPRQRAAHKWNRNAYAHLRTREYLCSLHYLLHYRNEHVESENEVFDSEAFLEQAGLYPNKYHRLEAQPKTWTDALGHIQTIYNHERGEKKYTYLVSA